MSVFPTIVDGKDDFQHNAPPNLPPIYARFFVPQLLDQPQDPIIDTLKCTKNERHHPAESNSPPRLIDFKEVWEGLAQVNVEPVEDIWQAAVRRGYAGRSQIYSWDALRTTSAIPSSSTGLLSEQDHIMFAAARHHVQPRLHDPDVDVQYVYQSDLLDALKMTALGTSSLLHNWDASNERFEELGRGCGKRTVIIVYGKDEMTSRSLISPFLTIGTALRRLEKLVLDLRSQTSGTGPAIHALAHALSTCLTFIRQSLDDCLPREVERRSDDNMCSVLWHYTPWEEILVTLATLCNRQQSVSPNEYQSLPTSPETIISLLYDTLKFHLEIRSPRITSSILAFMLTETSRDYIDTIGRSVGLLEGASGQEPGVSDEEFETFPAFFSPQLVTALPIARKSLGLLRAARPDHPISTQKHDSFAIWFWTHEEIEQSFENITRELPGESDSVETTDIEQPYSRISYRDELAQFRVFDLQPGLGIGRSYFDSAYTAAPEVRLRHFIDAFPEALPSVTPTLDHLAALVLQPLLDRCITLSTTLLSIFLSLPPPLSLLSHLKVMQSYMLLMSPSFKARLSSALFSDSTDFFPDVQSGRKSSLGSLRRHSHGGDVRDKVWAVGLAPALLERDIWPPVGADLSFFLRTVIMDSFVGGKIEGGNREEAIEEVESRLGFALKESDRNASWSNPLVVEALDFLYMDYKPPHPLDVVITPDILYKYQRLFSFLLRILRVESAIAAVFRMTRPSMPPLFPTLTSSHKLLLHFRFVAQSFVSSLSEYVYDTAIGGNFVPFLDKVCEGGTAHFSDVFSLAESHSETMDDILTACLVRTNLRVSATLLRDCLNTILEFAVVIGELFRGRLQEYEAAPMIHDLFARFRKKTASFMKSLSTTVDKSSTPRALVDMSWTGPQASGPVGGLGALNHLLVRLDKGIWWSESH